MKLSAQIIIGCAVFSAIFFTLILLLPENISAASTLYFPHTNHQGSVVVVTDGSGEVVGENRYYAYGEDRISSDVFRITERKYTNQIKDTETDIYYYNARYYDPSLSTFLSADPTDDQLNRYAYVMGNPVKFADPSGLYLIEDAGNVYIPPSVKGRRLPGIRGLLVEAPLNSSNFVTSPNPLTQTTDQFISNMSQTNPGLNLAITTNYWEHKESVNAYMEYQSKGFIGDYTRPIGLFGAGDVIDYGKNSDTRKVDYYSIVGYETGWFSMARSLYGQSDYTDIITQETVESSELDFALTGQSLIINSQGVLPSSYDESLSSLWNVFGFNPEDMQSYFISGYGTLGSFQSALLDLGVEYAIILDSGDTIGITVTPGEILLQNTDFGPSSSYRPGSSANLGIINVTVYGSGVNYDDSL